MIIETMVTKTILMMIIKKIKWSENNNNKNIQWLYIYK